MPALQVKDCPDHVYDRLRECAAQQNRSISQQTVTILEEYLGLREPSKLSRDSRHQRLPTSEFAGMMPTGPGVGLTQEELVARHERVWEAIDKLPPVPISDDCPSTVEIIREIREREAR